MFASANYEVITNKEKGSKRIEGGAEEVVLRYIIVLYLMEIEKKHMPGTVFQNANLFPRKRKKFSAH